MQLVIAVAQHTLEQQFYAIVMFGLVRHLLGGMSVWWEGLELIVTQYIESEGLEKELVESMWHIISIHHSKRIVNWIEIWKQ